MSYKQKKQIFLNLESYFWKLRYFRSVKHPKLFSSFAQVQNFFKTSFKIRIEIKLGRAGQSGPARPEDLQPWSDFSSSRQYFHFEVLFGYFQIIFTQFEPFCNLFGTKAGKKAGYFAICAVQYEAWPAEAKFWVLHDNELSYRFETWLIDFALKITTNNRWARKNFQREMTGVRDKKIPS